MTRQIKLVFNLILYFILLYFFYCKILMSRTEYSTIANNQTCLPIKKSYQPFKIKINNIFYPLHVSLHVNNSIDFECLNQAKKHKIILFWNKFWASDFFSNGKDEIFAKNKCPVTKCEITTDRSRVNESDFVVVGGGGGELTDLPLNVPSFRPENQRWIFFLYESPYSVIEYNGFNDFSKYNGVFNLTATYRSDSDFLTNFEGTAQMTWEKNTNYEIPYHLKKNKIAAALISNCEGDKSKRIDFINKLRKFIPIDVYGGCGEKKCPISQIRSACKELIANEYKFYFAFENSLCDEYITEKFFGMLKYNIVPVVRGDFSNRYAEFV
jgi:alpha-1,3-fucosyltransferase